jgi:hypothetical protein
MALVQCAAAPRIELDFGTDVTAFATLYLAVRARHTMGETYTTKIFKGLQRV